MSMVMIAAIAFVGTHFLLSHPLRAPIVGRVGEKGFLALYSLVAFATLGWLVVAYRSETVTNMLWPVGDGRKTFSKARKLLYTDPEMADRLLDMMTKSTIKYLKSQIRAGADMLQIFDSWAGVLPPEHYSRFSLKYIAKICDAITEVPITVFARSRFLGFLTRRKAWVSR